MGQDLFAKRTSELILRHINELASEYAVHCVSPSLNTALFPHIKVNGLHEP